MHVLKGLFLALAFVAMAKAALAQPVSTLPNASTPLSGSEIIYLIQNGASAKTTVGNLLTGSIAGSLASPPCIGCTTPNTGAFTTIAATQQANSRAGIGFLPDSGLAPRRSKLTVGFDGAFVLGNTLSATTTYFDAIPAPDDYFAVRTIMPINAGSNGATIGPILYRPSSTFTTAACSGNLGDNYVNPCDPNCVNGGSCWVFQTFTEGGVNSDVFGQQPRIHDFNATQTLVLPNIVSPDPTTGSTATARMVFSDWNFAVPLQRTDVSTTQPRVLMRRSVIPTGTITRCGTNPADTTESGQSWTGNTAWNGGYDYSTKFAVGTFTTNTDVTGTSPPSDIGPMCWTQFLVRTKGIQIVAIGDSWIEGNTTTSGMSNVWLRAAVALSSQTLPIMYAGTGWSGADSDQFEPIGVDLINAAQPSICVIESFTAADQITLYGTSRYYGRVLAMTKQCLDVGAKVILQGPWPRDTLSGSTLAAWQAFVTEVRGMGDAGVYLFDQLPLLGSYSTGQWASQYTTDGIHPNDSGVTAMLPAAELLLKNLIGID